MALILVRDDSGTTVWTERVTTEDFETEHFRRCLSERLWWAVSDAERERPMAPLRVVGEQPTSGPEQLPAGYELDGSEADDRELVPA